MEIFNYEFFRNAFFAGILSAVACGIIGSIIVSRRFVSIAGGIAHSSFGGVGLGYMLNFSPALGAMIFAVFSGAGIWAISKKNRQGEDVSIGIIWALGMSLGVLFIGLTKGYAPELFTYLFGNILSVAKNDIISIFIFDIIVVMCSIIFYKEIVGISFDQEFAKSRGVPVDIINLALLVVVSLAVVMLMKIVGIILVIAMLAIPSAAGRVFTATLKGMMFVSIGLCSIFTAAGLLMSYCLDLPSGAVIVVLSVVFYGLTLVFKKIFITGNC